MFGGDWWWISLYAVAAASAAHRHSRLCTIGYALTAIFMRIARCSRLLITLVVCCYMLSLFSALLCVRMPNIINKIFGDFVVFHADNGK